MKYIPTLEELGKDEAIPLIIRTYIPFNYSMLGSSQLKSAAIAELCALAGGELIDY